MAFSGRSYCPGKGRPGVKRTAVLLTPVILSLALWAPAACASRGSEVPAPPRLQLEAFDLGAGLRLFVISRLGLAAGADFRAPGQYAPYAYAGLLAWAARPFYELIPYGVVGAAYRLPSADRDAAATGSRWLTFATVGVELDVLFAEYQVLASVTRSSAAGAQGRFRWGLRLGF